MIRRSLNENNYDYPYEIAEGIFWIGYYDDTDQLHCNPYLIEENRETILVDCGSRTDFSSVMMKILQTGITPDSINKLIQQHYDPDLCSSIPHFEELIDNEDLAIISHRENNIFIKYYSVTSKRQCIESMKFRHTLAGSRNLRFIKTPYAHSAGSFMTYDERTETLLSSDLFGSYGRDWNLFLELEDECFSCSIPETCPRTSQLCPLKRMFDFHKRIMTSCKALRYAIDQLKELPVKMIAPQHGSILYRKEDIAFILEYLYKLEGVGIDGV